MVDPIPSEAILTAPLLVNEQSSMRELSPRDTPIFALKFGMPIPLKRTSLTSPIPVHAMAEPHPLIEPFRTVRRVPVQAIAVCEFSDAACPRTCPPRSSTTSSALTVMPPLVYVSADDVVLDL